MAASLPALVRREINRIRRDIAQRTSEVASLRGDLQKHQRVLRLLMVERGARRRARRRGRRRAMVDWNAVLRSLPASFTLNDIAKQPAVRGKPRAYLRQIVVRWRKQGKTKRAGRGRYQRV